MNNGKTEEYQRYRGIAYDNGIPDIIYEKRIAEGWPPESAATIPVGKERK